MRLRFAPALLVVIAGSIPAGASESLGLPPADVRANQIVVYDYEPGVITRDYWFAPWRDHHYFPWTGKRPKIGRLEHAEAHRQLKQAQSFRREWSNYPAFLSEAPKRPTGVPTK